MTRGRESNSAYLYERTAGEGDHEHRGSEEVHLARRGSGRDAAHLLRAIIATRDERVRTPHYVGAATEHEQLRELTVPLVPHRRKAAERRRNQCLNWEEETDSPTLEIER